jgi:hypothetical protein
MDIWLKAQRSESAKKSAEKSSRRPKTAPATDGAVAKIQDIQGSLNGSAVFAR